ncbi:MAG: hypothetical protein IBX61_08485 [Thermoleophilia bacterium]|nr:hypothetical protein [Thermoleophilia bacterium]
MTEKTEFPQLMAAARKLADGRDLSRDQLRGLLCRDCRFWHEQDEEELECSCFLILATLLAEGVLTPESLARSLRGHKTG